MKRFDVVLACVLTAAMLLEVWAEKLHPAGVVAPLMVVAGMSLLWRRRYPIAVGLVMIACAAIEMIAGMTLHSAIAPIVALFVASWSIGAYAPRRRAYVGLGLLVIGMWTVMGIDTAVGPDTYEATDFPWIGALLLAPGIAGIAFGARTRSLRRAEAAVRELELERREAAAAERTRIARDLHDVIAHSVAVMTVQAGAAEAMLTHDPDRALEPIRAVQDTGRQALVEMKHMVGALRQIDDDRGPEHQLGLADLDRLADRMGEAGLRVDVRIEGAPRVLSAGVDMSAYRVVQEALTNSLKHAGRAAAVTVTVRYGEHEVSIDVVDDGAGGMPRTGGHGLISMRERIGIVGGTFDAGPGENGGFAVHAHLPLEAPA